MITTRARIGFWGATVTGVLIGCGIWHVWFSLHPLQWQYKWTYIWTGIKADATARIKSASSRLAMPKPADTESYFVYVKGPWVATQSMLDNGMDGVAYKEIVTTPRKMHETLREQIYNGGSWNAFRWPLLTSLLVLFALQTTGSRFDAKRRRLLMTDGIQLRGRKMYSLRKFNGWGRKDDFVLKVSGYDHAKT